MAELEAITDVQAELKKSAVIARQYGRRFPLAPNKPLNLGRDEGKMDIAIPEDDQISRFQAVLTWEPEKGKLLIQTRPTNPGYPNPPANQTLIFNEKLKKLVEAPEGRCLISRGESFWIGQTRFTLHSDEEIWDTNEVVQEAAGNYAEFGAQVRDLGGLANLIRAVSSEEDLFRRLLEVVLEAVPAADAVTIIRMPVGSQGGQPQTIETRFRADLPADRMSLLPSRLLCQRAVSERRSRLMGWPADDKGNDGDLPETQRDDPLQTQSDIPNYTPWALCIPFQDSPRNVLYLAGRVKGNWQLLVKENRDKIIASLMESQQTAELLLGMSEIRLGALRLSRQIQVIRSAWPKGLWKYLSDPDELDRILTPKEMGITTLFCDLRNYSLFASRNADKLLEAQREIGNALNTMSSAITDRDGVVAGFRGDAVVGFWGWPKQDEKQVEFAARAALVIAGRLGDWKRTGRCGLGITHGNAVVGRLGAQDLSLVDLYGPVVNLTFRLETMTKAFGVPIIVSEEIAKRISVADSQGADLVTRPLGKVRAKGFPDPVLAYELYSADTPSLEEWQRGEWDRAVSAFTEGQWDKADKLLKSLFPDDTAAHCLIRVMAKASGKPPGDWDGSFVPLSSGDS